MKYQAYLFDCDGTIADTMPVHYKTWSLALKEWNCEFPEDLFYDWAGIPADHIVERLNERYGLKIPPQEIMRRKEELFLKMLHEVKPIEEVLQHIREQHKKIPLAVVSGGNRKSVTRILDALGLLDRFDAIVAAEDVKNFKPHPEPFLTAAKRLGVAPEKCLVFEDADLGIEAAKAAGMDWVRIESRVSAAPAQVE